MSQPKLGRVQHWDVRNENFYVDEVAPYLRAHARLLTNRRTLAANRDRSWRQWWWGDQGTTSQCTAYGTLHLMAAAPVIHPRQNPLLLPEDLYKLIQSIDKDEGRDYGWDEGATTLAACKAAMRMGWIGGYEWVRDFETALGYLHDVGPLLVGTNWYSSMDTRDEHGNIRITPSAVVRGGHLYCVNGLSPNMRRARIAQTWGDGYYYISIEDLRRLFYEDGEIALLRELPF
jgi:hypothetical protein